MWNYELDDTWYRVQSVLVSLSRDCMQTNWVERSEIKKSNIFLFVMRSESCLLSRLWTFPLDSWKQTHVLDSRSCAVLPSSKSENKTHRNFRRVFHRMRAGETSRRENIIFHSLTAVIVEKRFSSHRRSSLPWSDRNIPHRSLESLRTVEWLRVGKSEWCPREEK